MKRWKRTTLLLALLLLVASLTLYWKLPREAAEPVTVVEASLGTIEQSISAPGSVEAGRKVLVPAEPTARIVALYFREQDLVKEGQILAKLDDTELSAQLQQTEAALKLAEANLAHAQKVLEETQALYRKGYVARQEVDTAQGQVNLYQTQIEEKKAALQLLKAKLGRAWIRAPIGGVITRKFVEVGGIVSASSRGGGQLQPAAIAEIADLSALEFHVEVDQTEISRVRRGQQAVIALDAFPDRRFTGFVEEITLASVEELGERVRYKVKVALQKPGVRLRLGMTGTADFILSKKEKVLTLPASVILQKGEEEYVFVVDNGRARRRVLRTGLKNEEVVEVVSGLQPGEKVIDQGKGKVKDGQMVEVLNATR